MENENDNGEYRENAIRTICAICFGLQSHLLSSKSFQVVLFSGSSLRIKFEMETGEQSYRMFFFVYSIKE